MVDIMTPAEDRGCAMTENQATALRDKLLAHRARLLDFAAQQVDADPNSLGWLRMHGDVQAALTAVEEATGEPTP